MRPLTASLLVVVACGSGDESCPPLKGTFLATYEEHDGGTCPPQTPSLVEFGGATVSAPDGGPFQCNMDETVSEDGCRFERMNSCARLQPNGLPSVTGTGTLIIHVDSADSAHGILELEQPGLCRSVYDVAFERQ